MSRQKDKIYVVGHKNPDTDSICSAIAYAALKTKLTGHAYEPRRAGQLNEETQYVLEKFAVKPPKLLSDLREQIKDVELKEVEGLTSNSSIRTAWETMRELNIHTLPVVRDGSLEGVITIGDIAKTYMDVYDSMILSKARTQYRNIARAVDGEVITGNEHSYLLNGKVVIAELFATIFSIFFDIIAVTPFLLQFLFPQEKPVYKKVSPCEVPRLRCPPHDSHIHTPYIHAVQTAD